MTRIQRVRLMWVFVSCLVQLGCRPQGTWLPGGPGVTKYDTTPAQPFVAPREPGDACERMRLDERAARQAFVFFAPTMDVDFLAAHIGAVNPGRADIQLPDRELARKILIVSEEFGLDPFIFTSMIRKESTFQRRAVSPTGAAGLTQMTVPGIKEVNRQLGVPGPRYLFSDIDLFVVSLRQGCIAQRLGYGEWKPLYARTRHYPEMKRALMADPDTSLIYGAVLLRTLVFSLTTEVPGSALSLRYRWALKRYNGDELEKDNYQRTVMQWAKQLHTRWVRWDAERKFVGPRLVRNTDNARS